MSSLVTALVLTRLDCGNATLAGLPTCQLNRLQSVLHADARLVCGARKYDHVTSLLQELHWLSVLDRITFKLATLVFRCMHGLAQAYLAETLNCAADVNSCHAFQIMAFRHKGQTMKLTSLQPGDCGDNLMDLLEASSEEPLWTTADN